MRGRGLIEGNGFIWWWVVYITGEDNRPDLLDIITCKDTLIEELTFQNAPMYHLSLLDALNMTVQNLLIRVNVTPEQFPGAVPTFPLNTDGIDISGRDVYMRNLTIENYDDAVAVKPLSTFGGKYSNCSENMLIEDCQVKWGVGMSIGSVGTDPNLSCVRNITFRNIVFKEPIKVRGRNI
jgi:polygalacturonase